MTTTTLTTTTLQRPAGHHVGPLVTLLVAVAVAVTVAVLSDAGAGVVGLEGRGPPAGPRADQLGRGAARARAAE